MLGVFNTIVTRFYIRLYKYLSSPCLDWCLVSLGNKHTCETHAMTSCSSHTVGLWRQQFSNSQTSTSTSDKSRALFQEFLCLTVSYSLTPTFLIAWLSRERRKGLQECQLAENRETRHSLTCLAVCSLR